MGHHSVILMFGLISALYGYACVSGTKRIIQKVGIHNKYFPQCYIMPSRIIRQVFSLERKLIPKCFYIEMFMVIPIAILFVISSLTYLITDKKLLAINFFWWLYILIGVIYLIFNVIFLIKYR